MIESEDSVDSDNEARSGTPPCVREAGMNAVDNLLPDKSKTAYEQSYTRFLSWQKDRKATSFSQRVLLAYFSELSKKWKSSTLWSEYSKIAKMLKIKNNLDLGEYRELKAFLKKTSVGYKPKKSKTLTSQDVERFLNEAPDFTYLATKVAMIFGVLGACRKDELIKVKTTDLKTYHEPSDTERKHPTLLVHVPDTKTHQEREFAIKGVFYNYFEKYRQLRPDKTPHERFFINYQKGKCTVQPIGEKKFAFMPKEIAQFLNLPNADSYTGHAFRRTSATLLAESGADIAAVKRHGGWKSTSVAESYVENTFLIKSKTSDQITSSIQLNLPSTSKECTANANLRVNPVKATNENPPSASEGSNDKENCDPVLDLAGLNKHITLNLSHCANITFNILDKK